MLKSLMSKEDDDESVLCFLEQGSQYSSDPKQTPAEMKH